VTPGFVVTLIGREIDGARLDRVALTAKKHGFALAGTQALSRANPAALDLFLGAPDAANPDALRAELLALRGDLACDVALQRDDDARRHKRLCVFDMDSTLIRQEVIDELARARGIVDQVAAITHRAMNGELDFDAALRERVALLAGAPVTILREVLDRIELTPGADNLLAVLKRIGCRTAVLSGGFTDVTLPLAARIGLDHAHANTLETRDGLLTGRVLGPIVNRKRKGDLLAEIAAQEGVPVECVMAIGDGANDLDMLARAGLGVAFHAKPAVQLQAPVVLNQPRLDAVLYLLGMTDADVQVAGA
jgi:phosphoserine phosphatase